MDRQICSKTLWFKVSNEADRHIIDTITQTGQNPLTCCENLIFAGDNVLLLNRYKKMSLRHGMDTVQKTLALTEKPIRIKPDHESLPEYFFQKLIDDTIQVKLTGNITRSELRSLVAKSQKGIEAKVLEKYDENVDQRREQNHIENPYYLRKDLEYGQNFSYTIHRTNKTVQIQSFKETANSCEKKKHYFIYSNHPGYGRKTFITVMLENLNATVVTDLDNFCGVRDNAQFLIFDGFSFTSITSYRQLCLLTGGDASVLTGTKRTYINASYIPRSDAQVVIFSNSHLFQCMKKFHEDGIHYGMAEQMLDRFHIIKLDDETRTEIEDALLHIDVSHITALRNPFDVGINQNGYPIDENGNLTPYSLACKYDTRHNKAFNHMKASILFQTGKTAGLNDNLNPKKDSDPRYSFNNMCVDDMLKRYLNYQGRLDEFLECDSNFDILDYFLKHQTAFKSFRRCLEFIFENRHKLYESLANKNANTLDIKEKANKWYDPKVYEDTLTNESYCMIRNQQTRNFFEIVMREINNPDQSLVKRKASELLNPEL